MTRQVYLRDDFYMTFGSVLNHLTYLFLSVVSTIAAVSLTIGGGTHLPVSSPGSFLRELRVLAYLNPPAVVVGQMPVEAVELMGRHPVDEPEHMFSVKECAGDIQHRPAVAVSG